MNKMNKAPGNFKNVIASTFQRWALVLLIGISAMAAASCGGGGGGEAAGGGGTTPTLDSIAITPNPITITAGFDISLTATGTYSDASTADITGKVTWSSDTTSVADVSTGGVASAVSAGSAIISAKLDGVSNTVTVDVITTVDLLSIAITPDPLNATVGTDVQLTAMGSYSNMTTNDITGSVTWASDDTVVADVSVAGLLTPNAGGTAGISATLGAVSNTVTATVSGPLALVSILITPDPLNVELGTDVQLIATGTYNDASEMVITNDVTWESGTMGVATVSTTGLLAPVTKGSSLITATLGAVSDTVTANVTAVLTSIVITPDPLDPVVGTDVQLTATGHYNDSTSAPITSSVTWKSGTLGVATVSTTGLLAPVAKGSSLITATLGAVSDTVVANVTVPPPVDNITISENGGAAITVTEADDATVPGIGKDPYLTFAENFMGPKSGSVKSLNVNRNFSGGNFADYLNFHYVGAATGTFDVNSANYNFGGTNFTYENNSAYPALTNTITITTYNAVGGVIEGSYTLTLCQGYSQFDSNCSLTIQLSGSFSITREADIVGTEASPIGGLPIMSATPTIPSTPVQNGDSLTVTIPITTSTNGEAMVDIVAADGRLVGTGGQSFAASDTSVSVTVETDGEADVPAGAHDVRINLMNFMPFGGGIYFPGYFSSTNYTLLQMDSSTDYGGDSGIALGNQVNLTAAASLTNAPRLTAAPTMVATSAGRGTTFDVSLPVNATTEWASISLFSESNYMIGSGGSTVTGAGTVTVTVTIGATVQPGVGNVLITLQNMTDGIVTDYYFDVRGSGNYREVQQTTTAPPVSYYKALTAYPVLSLTVFCSTCEYIEAFSNGGTPTDSKYMSVRKHKNPAAVSWGSPVAENISYAIDNASCPVYINIDNYGADGTYSILAAATAGTGSSSATPAAPDDYESDDTDLTATTLVLGAMQDHSLPGGDEDWFFYMPSASVCPPDANNMAVTTTVDTPVTTAYDALDINGDAVTFNIVTNGANGTAADNGDGTFTYTPNAGYTGPDSFTYRAIAGGLSSNIATVNVTVNP